MAAMAVLGLAAAGTWAGEELPAAALSGVQRGTRRADGSYSLRLGDGSTAYAWKTSAGYSVSFPGSRRGQIWTRTPDGWRVTDLEMVAGRNDARRERAQAVVTRGESVRAAEARRLGSKRSVCRIGQKR